jgi:hypothetical protein
MRPFLASLWGFILFVAGLFLAAISGMIQDEIRTRLGRVPYALIRLAVSRVPQNLRAELGEEWRGELAAILKATEDVPVTGLASAVWFAVGLLIRGPAIARELTGTARRFRDLRVLQILSRHLGNARGFKVRLPVRSVPDQLTAQGTPAGNVAVRLPVKIVLIVAAAMVAVVTFSVVISHSYGQTYAGYGYGAPP